MSSEPGNDNNKEEIKQMPNKILNPIFGSPFKSLPELMDFISKSLSEQLNAKYGQVSDGSAGMGQHTPPLHVMPPVMLILGRCELCTVRTNLKPYDITQGSRPHRALICNVCIEDLKADAGKTTKEGAPFKC